MELVDYLFDAEQDTQSSPIIILDFGLIQALKCGLENYYTA